MRNLNILKHNKVLKNVENYIKNGDIDSIKILRNNLCSYLINDYNLEQLHALAHALQINNTTNKTKSELCDKINTRLIIYEKTGTLIADSS